jgi:hypothetical protein
MVLTALTRRDGNLWLRRTEGQVYASDMGQELELNRMARNWALRAGSGPESGPHGELQARIQNRCSGLLRAAYSSLILQSRWLRSRSGNGIWRGQDSVVSIVAVPNIQHPFNQDVRIIKECILITTVGCSTLLNFSGLLITFFHPRPASLYRY